MIYTSFALILQLLCIPAVILIFKVWDKIPASFVATSLFLIVGFLTLSMAARSLGWRSMALWGALQFLIFFALPIGLMRVMYPDQEMAGLHLGPLGAAQLHRFSNFSFLFMTLLTIIDLVRLYRARA